MEQNNKSNLKSKLTRRVDRVLGWGIMGSLLIIALTLGIVGACAAAKNKEGITATIAIGAIALFLLLAYVVVKSLSKRPQNVVEQPIEPKDLEDSKQEPVVVVIAEESPVEEGPVAEVPAEPEAPAQEVVVEVAEEAPAAEEEVVEEAQEAQEPEAPAQEVVEEIAAVEVPAEPEAPVVVITAEEAHDSMSDEEALALVEVRSKTVVDGPMCTVNVGMLSATFAAGEEVTLDALQAKGLIPRKQNGYIVLAKGNIDKALIVIANDFSADAVKMIVAAGGKAIGC